VLSYAEVHFPAGDAAIAPKYSPPQCAGITGQPLILELSRSGEVWLDNASACCSPSGPNNTNFEHFKSMFELK
jgi:hypothetical protein